jgi:predicted AlkP superfamily phosphohydrolase/phosphomutase
MTMAKRRALIVGWDGATYRWITPLLEEGRLPTLRRLTEEGAAGALRSTMPPHTAPGWTTVMTGKSPAGHGVFLFDEVMLQSYSCRGRILDSRLFAGQTIFDVVGAAGGKVAALWVPMTHPAWAVNGVMVSGYPAPHRGRGRTHPADRTDLLERVPVDPLGVDPAQLMAVYERKIAALTEIAREHVTDPSYDLVMVVYQEPDTAHHLFWKYSDPAYPRYDPAAAARYGNLVARCYERLDAALSHLLEAVDPDTLVLLMSDHGGAPAPTRYLHLNSWLASSGYLTARKGGGTGSEAAGTTLSHRVLEATVKRTPVGFRRALKAAAKSMPRGVLERIERTRFNADAIDWSRTQAYRFPILPTVEGVVINVRGRQPEGTVDPGAAYTRVRADLAARLRDVCDPETGQRAVAAIHFREDLYPHGPFAEQAPDLFIELAESHQAGQALAGRAFTAVPEAELDRYSGTHDMTGIVFARGTGVRAGYQIEGMGLLDVAPTLLWALEQPIPESMEGTIRHDLFAEGARSGPAAYMDFATQSFNTDFIYSEEEEESVRDRLRALGYIE